MQHDDIPELMILFLLITCLTNSVSIMSGETALVNFGIIPKLTKLVCEDSLFCQFTILVVYSRKLIIAVKLYKTVFEATIITL